MIQSRCDDTRTFMDVADEGEGCLVLDCRNFHVPDLDRFVRDLYAAAGNPEPVILDPAGLPPGICHYSDGVKVFAEGDKVRLQATESHSAKEYWHAKLTPSAARKLAANIAALADFAQEQPDPAEIEELARALHRARERNDGEPGEWDRRSASTALRWMKQRQEAS